MWWCIATNFLRDPGQVQVHKDLPPIPWVRVAVRLAGVRRSLWGFPIPAEPPDLVDMLRTIPNRIVLAAAEVETLSPKPSLAERAAVVDQAATATAALHTLAASRGWRAEDIAGTGLGGDAGAAGGRSVASGLTLAELTLTRPPIDWPELAARGRPPWESTNWIPPHPTWIAPAWAPLPPLPDRRDAPTESPIVPPTPPGAVDDGDELERELDDETTPNDPPGDDSDGEDPDGDPMAGYPAEHLATARALVLEIATTNGGAEPHPNKVNYYLRRLDPPPPNLNTAQIHHLLTT